MAKVEHDGQSLEEFLAPVTRRLLIPVFFVALGLQIEWSLLWSETSLTAAAAALALFGLRAGLHRSVLRIADHRRAFLLLGPNLTIVALAVTTLLNEERFVSLAQWVLLTGLFVTVSSLAWLPSTRAPVPSKGQPEAVGTMP